MDTIENYLEHYRKEQAGSAYAEILSIFNRLNDEQMQSVLAKLQYDYRAKRIAMSDNAHQQEIFRQKREHVMQLQDCVDWWGKRCVQNWLDDCEVSDERH